MNVPAAANAPAARKSLAEAIADVPAIIARMNAPLPRFNPARTFIAVGYVTGAPGFSLYLSTRHGVCNVDWHAFRYGTNRRPANGN